MVASCIPVCNNASLILGVSDMEEEEMGLNEEDEVYFGGANSDEKTGSFTYSFITSFFQMFVLCFLLAQIQGRTHTSIHIHTHTHTHTLDIGREANLSRYIVITPNPMFCLKRAQA